MTPDVTVLGIAISRNVNFPPFKIIVQFFVHTSFRKNIFLCAYRVFLLSSFASSSFTLTISPFILPPRVHWRYQAFSRYPSSATADGLCYVTRGSHSRGHRPRANGVILADVYPLTFVRESASGPQEHPEGKNVTTKARLTRGFSSTTAIVQPQKEKALSSCTPSFSGCDSCNNETLITRTNSCSRVLFEQLGSVSLEQARKFSFFICIFIRSFNDFNAK